MTRYGSKFAHIFFIIVLFSCGKDDEENPLLNPFKNTIWFFNGDNCDTYYDFGETSYIALNPCFDGNNIMDLLAWKSGAYSFTNDLITLNIVESCESSAIESTESYNYKIEGNTLTFSLGTETLILQKTSAFPNIPTTIDFGYFDFNNDGVWVSVESCISPYE